VIALIAYLQGEPDRYAPLRAVFDARIDPGPVTADEMQLYSSMVNEGIWDLEYAMVRTGIDDPDEMAARIAEDRVTSLSERARKADVMKVFADSGVGVYAAARVAGFSVREARRMEQSAAEKAEQAAAMQERTIEAQAAARPQPTNGTGQRNERP
jgi:hypothetical protein